MSWRSGSQEKCFFLDLAGLAWISLDGPGCGTPMTSGHDGGYKEEGYHGFACLAWRQAPQVGSTVAGRLERAAPNSVTQSNKHASEIPEHCKRARSSNRECPSR